MAQRKCEHSAETVGIFLNSIQTIACVYFEHKEQKVCNKNLQSYSVLHSVCCVAHSVCVRPIVNTTCGAFHAAGISSPLLGAIE